MANLEEEFQQLMQKAIREVQEKYDKGELSLTEAADLIQMIQNRMRPPVLGDEPEPGWNQSSWCGDTAWESSEKCW